MCLMNTINREIFVVGIFSYLMLCAKINKNACATLTSIIRGRLYESYSTQKFIA